MAKFRLFKTPADTYLLSGLLILGSLSFHLVKKVRQPASGELVANVYVINQKVHTLSLKMPRLTVYYDAEKPESIEPHRLDLEHQYDYVPLSAPYGEMLLGPITVEVKEGKVAVIEETSKHHYCRIQGATNTPNWPITCAPNYFVIIVEVAS
ncbi:MAG: NusG domain II-containing protein [Bacilli bacterium]|jgi:hypothetical protein